MEEDEAVARLDKEVMLRLAEMACKTSETDVKQLQDEKQMQAVDSKIARNVHRDQQHHHQQYQHHIVRKEDKSEREGEGAEEKGEEEEQVPLL
jgi:hypothetical protein